MTLSKLHALLNNMIADHRDRYDFPIVVGTQNSIATIKRVDAREGIVIIIVVADAPVDVQIEKIHNYTEYLKPPKEYRHEHRHVAIPFA